MVSLVTVLVVLLLVAGVFVIGAYWDAIEEIGAVLLQVAAVVVGVVLIVAGLAANSFLGGLLVLVGIVIGGAGAYNLYGVIKGDGM
jgi:hypothetical protein